ncbi:MAG: protein arginine kinase [Planctomycetes bacterium]|nr:protein arginine kinase [Planctomycetota bacterium]
MTLSELTHSTGEWLRGVGSYSDVVISSRIRLARNLASMPFLSTATVEERTNIYQTLAKAIGEVSNGSNALLIDIENAEAIDRHLLVERHLISRQHAVAEGSRGVSISPTETLALMINEEDHLRIQALRSGLQLEDAWSEVNEVDDKIGKNLTYAFDQQFGFLTVCPTNVGTGIRVSVMVHLPALKLTKEIERVDRAARDMRLAVRGMYGEGTEAVGDLYQISNQTTLGRHEEEIIDDFSGKIIPRIAEYELTARDSLAKHRGAQVDDKIWRAYGALANARCISSEETLNLLSAIRMGIHMGRLDLIDIPKLNEIFLFTQPAHMQKRHGAPLTGEERAVKRADYIRKQMVA